MVGAIAVAAFAVHLIVVTVIRNNGWDDGSITLAFSRTFAASGRIALTPASEEVEGFSSVAWFAIMAVAAVMGLDDFDSMVRTSQVVAGLCAAGAAAVFFVTARRFVSARVAAVTAVALFVTAPFLNETMNGMEMSLLAGLVLGLVHQLTGERPTTRALVLLSFLAATVRFEAALYLCCAAAVVWWFPAARREAVAIAGGAIGGIAATAVLRWVFFQELLPNTIAAKQWPPYSQDGLGAFLVSRARAAAEPFLPLAVAGLVVLALMWLSRRRLTWRQDASSPLRTVTAFCLAYVGAVFAFNVAIGWNLGYIGRMQLSALPLLVLAGMYIVQRAGFGWTLARTGLTAAGLVLGSMVFLQWANVGYALGPGTEQGTEVRVTPDGYRKAGDAVERIAAELGRDSLTFLTPDIGGSSLAAPTLRILDLGLLANRQLAEEGFENFDGYLAEQRPDVIEAHGTWAQESGIYRSPAFLGDYTPVVVDDMWLWMRNELAADLPSGSPPDGDLTELRYRGDPGDERFLESVDVDPVYVR
jgi:hypothetical protein